MSLNSALSASYRRCRAEHFKFLLQKHAASLLYKDATFQPDGLTALHSLARLLGSIKYPRRHPL